MTFLNNKFFNLRVFFSAKLWLYLSLVAVSTIVSSYASLDSASYQEIFRLYSTNGWDNFYGQLRGSEPFYLVTSKLLSGWPSIYWFVLIASISVGLKISLIQRASSHFYMSFLIYFSYFFILFDGTAIRSSLAIIVAYWGAWFFSKQRLVLAAILVFIAFVCFHYSLIFFFVVVFFKNYRATKVLIISYPILVLLWYFGYDFLSAISDVIQSLNPSEIGIDKLRTYLLLTEFDAYPYSVQFVFLFFYTVAVYRRYYKELTEFELICINCVLMSIVTIALLVGAPGIQIRTSEIFRFGLVFIFPYYYRYLLEWVKKPWLATCLMLLALIGYFYYYVILAGLIVWPKAWSLPL